MIGHTQLFLWSGYSDIVSLLTFTVRGYQISIAYCLFHFKIDINKAWVLGSTIGTNGIPISFQVLPMAQLLMPLVPMVPSTTDTDSWLQMIQRLQCG